MQLRHLVTLNLVFTLDWLSHTHRPRDVHAKDYRDVFGRVAPDKSILDLGGCLQEVSHGEGLRLLFIIDHYLIRVVTELTLPDLVAILFCKHTLLIENTLAFGAEFGITSRDLAFVGKAVKLDFEHVGVEFLTVHVCTFLLLCSASAFELFALLALLDTRLIVTEVQTTTEVIRVHLFSRVIASEKPTHVHAFFLLLFYGHH